MSLRARDKVEPAWYVLEDQDGQEKPARFKVRPLNSGEKLDLMSTHDPETGKPTGRTWAYCFSHAVMQIENVEGANGKPVRSPMQFLNENFVEETPDGVRDIGAEVVTEVGAEIYLRSYVTEEERKNS